MYSIALLTATYNHPEELSALYVSLLGQTDREFTWIVVSDGSGAETDAVLDAIKQEQKLDVVIIRQKNGGKSSAINRGIDAMSREVELFVIVDDDEQLKPGAVETVRRYQQKYGSTDCGVIHFNRVNEMGEMIANPEITQDFKMSYQRFKSEGRGADGYVCYLRKWLGDNRFHIYEGEKYISPSTLFMRVTADCSLLWAGAVLGQTEYLEGGITKQGRRLRLKNPRGMLECCELMQTNGASFKIRAIYSVMGYAYLEFLRPEMRAQVRDAKLMKWTKLPGKALAAYWKRKYQNS